MGYDKYQRRNEIFRISQKEKLFWSLIRTNCSSRSHHVPPLFPNSSFRETTILPLSFSQIENSHGQSFERRAYWFVSNLLGIGYPHRPSGNGYITTLNITLMFKSLYDKYMPFAPFYRMQGKNRSLVCISS